MEVTSIPKGNIIAGCEVEIIIKSIVSTKLTSYLEVRHSTDKRLWLSRK
jgi:hypothetical protein